MVVACCWIAGSALVRTRLVKTLSRATAAIQQQATTIAEAYLEEIMLRSFNDPDEPELGGSEGEASRAEYDDVKDYRALPPNDPAANQFGVAIPELAQYRVTVTITNDSLNGIPGNDSLRVDVSVSHPAIQPITLSGYRSNYCPTPAVCP